MNIQEYISSGILEAYALGELSEEEKHSVEQKLFAHPELKQELERIEKTQEDVIMKAAIVPPSGLREKLMARVDEIPSTRVMALNPESSLLFWRIATAASVSLALIASYFAVEYRSQMEASRAAFEELHLKNQQLAQQYGMVNDRIDRITGALNILDNPAYTRTVLQGTEVSPDAVVSLFWNKRSSEVFIRIQNLAELPVHRQYQLWAIVEGKAVNAGVFDLSTELLKMNDIDEASAFAITVEKRGGSDQPTQATIQAIGKTGG